MRYLLFIGLSLILCFSCSPEVTLKTPEEVAQFWLENYYKNNFDAAKDYSTAPTQEMIDTIRASIFTDLDDALDFKIKAVKCEINGKLAACTYLFVEGKEEIPEKIQLKQEGTQWLVDAELLSEEELLEDEEIEEIFDAFEDSLDKALD